MSALPTDVTVSSTQIEDGEFTDAVPSVSVEEALLRVVEMPEPCYELVYSANVDKELFKVLTSFFFSNCIWFYSTG